VIPSSIASAIVLLDDWMRSLGELTEEALDPIDEDAVAGVHANKDPKPLLTRQLGEEEGLASVVRCCVASGQVGSVLLPSAEPSMEFIPRSSVSMISSVGKYQVPKQAADTAGSESSLFSQPHGCSPQTPLSSITSSHSAVASEQRARENKKTRRVNRGAGLFCKPRLR